MLIAIATYGVDDLREELINTTLNSLMGIDLDAHRIVVSDNGSRERTQRLLSHLEFIGSISVIRNGANIGTAKAINKVIALRKPGEIVTKFDDDALVPDQSWPDQIEWVMHQEPQIGILGLKRRDLEECPTNPNIFYRSRLEFVKREKGDAWVVVEYAKSIMGTCTAFSPALLNTIGYMYQPGTYGFDDTDMSLRARLAGFKTAFLPTIEISHPDPGGTPYTMWKQDHSGMLMDEWNKMVDGYQSGRVPLYRGA